MLTNIVQHQPAELTKDLINFRTSLYICTIRRAKLTNLKTQHEDILEQLSAGKLDDSITGKLGEVAKSVAASFEN